MPKLGGGGWANSGNARKKTFFFRRASLTGVTLAIIDMEMMLEVLMGIMDMEVDKVANEVADMV